MKFLCTVALAAFAGILLAPSVHADDWNKKTELTVVEPIRLPSCCNPEHSVTLQPGEYVMKLVESSSDRHIVRVFDKDEKNVITTILVFCKLGWLSVVCVFLTYFFMSIMFPTIFALGIFGLGARAKKASAFIVMAIMGGAVLPKVMGAVADRFDMSRGFIVPTFCFAFVAFYGFNWSRFSKAESLHSVKSAV